jgi:hypothetical protein
MVGCGTEWEIRSGLSSLVVIELCGYKLGGGARLRQRESFASVPKMPKAMSLYNRGG